MYNLCVHMTECKPSSTVASARIARFICHVLAEARFNLVDTQDKAKVALLTTPFTEIDHLIIVNGPMAFCDFLPELGELVTRAKKVIWVQQDYTISPPAPESKAESPFRKAFADKKLRPDYWTTVTDNVKSASDHYINWNQLTFDATVEHNKISHLPLLMYYGAYREKRHADFVFYFQNAPYPVHVSTTPIRGKKFKALDNNIHIIPPFEGVGNMPVCSASLYIEDIKSHTQFHSPANRFYELLSAGVPILFDVRTIPNLVKAGIRPRDEWIVKSKEDVYKFINKPLLELYDVQQTQWGMWNEDYVGLLKERLLQVWSYYA